MRTKRILSAFLVISMILSILFVPAYADNGENSSVTVMFSAQRDGEFLTVPREISVTDGIAEEYGYRVAEKDHNNKAIDGPTFFDAMVTVHKAKYGDAFTAETAEDYLCVNNGTITKAFENESSVNSFFINSKMPVDDILVESDWGNYYTGYASDTARLKNGDSAEFWFYTDSEGWSDCYTAFDKSEVEIKTGDTLELTIYKNSFNSDSTCTLTPIDGTDEENNYITIHTVNDNGSISDAIADIEGNEITPDKDGKILLSFDKAGTYIVTAQGFVNSSSAIVAPYCTVTVTEPVKPESVTITHNAQNVIDGKIVVAKGDKFKLTALDQNGEETPVTWKASYVSDIFTLDEKTGDVEIVKDVYSGGTSYFYFDAVSTLDESVTSSINLQVTGYKLSQYQKNVTVTLPEDGQTAKTASVTGGFSGHNIWSYEVPDGVAELSTDPGNSGSIKFNVFRPGEITVSFKLDTNEELSDTAAISITGAAVEDNKGNRGKTYINVSAENPESTVQLCAYLMEGRTVKNWESADETIAAVDENGLVTAKGIGSAIITVTDSEGTKGGIKVVVSSEDIPYFESLEFSPTAFSTGTWVKGETFVPTKLNYDLPIKNYSTSSLLLQNTTLYDTEKYNAVAEYTDANGKNQQIKVGNGTMTTLPNQPFGNSEITITISDKNNPENKTVYTFNVSRPRDTNKVIKSNGISVAPSDRALSSVLYNSLAEGVMRKADADGGLTTGIGVTSSQYYYRTFVYDDAESFKLTLTSSTAYAHIRYSTDGQNWAELPQGGGITEKISFSGTDVKEITIQIIDDAAYYENTHNQNNNYFEGEVTEYKVWVDKVQLSSPKVVTSDTDIGDWYPKFNENFNTYWIVTEADASAPVLSYKVNDGASVKMGNNVQTPDENGMYSLTLTTSLQSVTVTSADGNYSNVYKFAYMKKSSLDVPDKVVDYLCIGSQYTNAGYGMYPEQTLKGSLKSLGNFGGYITYYYEMPLTDDPNNKYGMDFYVLGNSMETNIDSMAELGQVYVSEDGAEWYALAGSEHYEDNAIWDYTITYTKGEDGKSYWTDNYGNSIMSGAEVSWPTASVYSLNSIADRDAYTFTGILFKSQQGSITGDNSAASYASSAKFGYADYYANNMTAGTIADVNPYVENPSKANGFDLAWAVDKDGTPVDVKNKEFHYVKVATASNIWAGGYKEKSTEVAYVVRTSAQENEVGKTTAPADVTISDGADEKTVTFNNDQTVYSANLGNMKYVSVTVNGTADDDNIYINNQRVISGESAEGFKVTKEKGETPVRIIVQNGDKEPVIYLLKLSSEAVENDKIVEGIKVNAEGSIRSAQTKDGKNYSAAVGYNIGSIGITPIVENGVNYKINGDSPLEIYEIEYGKNVFEISATDENNNTETVILTVTRDSAPVISDTAISVSFSLYGDEKHGDGELHTYKNNKRELPVWISNVKYKVPKGSTVLDVFEKALTDAGIEWVNKGRNYISSINGLSEFDNGTLSGWMYMVDGKYSDLGVSENLLSDGSRIVFHYTDDYTQESNSVLYSGSAGGASKVETEQTADTPVNDKNTDSENKIFTETTFNDINKDDWHYESVKYVYEKGIMNGTGKGFEPESNMTRAMVVTVLYRLANPENIENDNPFSDISKGEWYYDAVKWAAANKIVFGVSETEFDPNSYVTREQLVTFMYRFAKYKAYDVENRSDLSKYKDSNEISNWADEAFSWANSDGIIQGTSETELSPSGNATRAQTAAILMRFCNNIIK